MVNGYNGNILRINLTESRFSIENPEEIFYRRYVGGEGFVAYYLLKELKTGIDPLSPENILIFATGPLTGFAIPGTGRNSVGAKSPLTGGFGEAEVGGHWGAELKHAGFDAIIMPGFGERMMTPDQEVYNNIAECLNEIPPIKKVLPENDYT